MTLTKDRLIASIVGNRTPKKEAVRIVETMLETIKATLENEEDILISGFGKFYVKDKSEKNKKKILKPGKIYSWMRDV